MKNEIDNPQTLSNRPTQENGKNPLAVIEAKILNALSDYETHSKTAEDKEKQATEILSQAKEAKETAQMNLKLAESMKAKKEEIIEAANGLKKLGCEHGLIAIELARLEEGQTEEGQTEEGQTEEGQTEEGQIEEGKKAESWTNGTSTSTSGDAKSDVGNGKSGSGDANYEAIAMPVCCDVEGYSFKFSGETVEKNLVKFEMLTPGNKEMEGAAILTTAGGANVGMRSRSSEAIIYTSNEKFPTEWDAHLFAIETALQSIKSNLELKVAFPHRAVEVPQVSFRENGLIALDFEASELVKKCNGYTVSFVEAKDYTLKGQEYTGFVLKIMGEGTTFNGGEVFCSFESNSSEYELICKDAKGKQYKDSCKSKREAMPREFEAIRHGAIAWMRSNFPLTSSKWEGQVIYTTLSPVKPKDSKPANAAAAPVK